MFASRVDAEYESTGRLQIWNKKLDITNFIQNEIIKILRVLKKSVLFRFWVILLIQCLESQSKIDTEIFSRDVEPPGRNYLGKFLSLSLIIMKNCQ